MRVSVALIMGGVGVFIALVLLWRSTRTTTVEPMAVATESSSSMTTSPASLPAGSQPSRPGLTATPSQPPQLSAPPSVPAERGSPERKFSVDNPNNLHFGGAQLREQTAAVDALVRQCVSNAASQKLSGNAVLTFIVAKRGDKYLVEDTGIDREKSSLQSEPLLECLHKTATSMKFVGLPRDAEALSVDRRVKLENGALTEHKMIGFSYIH
jgi:hypothetical protein